jgi:tRNA pseudouridine55 synthase
MVDGLINLDKPLRMSSAQAVGAVRHCLGRGTKVGHAGTLDPLATGVLLVLVGKATKRCEELMNSPKEYVATVRLGATTPTLDTDTSEIIDPAAMPVDERQVREALGRFIGQIQQMPPVYSALKIGGKPAYELARKGREVTLESRIVRIDAMELLGYGWPELTIRVACGRGTYIRSLARDIAAALGTTGYLSALQRTRVGEYRVDGAVTLETLRRDGGWAHLQA